MPFGVPFRPSPFHAAFDLTIGGERVAIDRTVQYRYSDPVAGEKRSQLNVSPAFDVDVNPRIAMFPLADSQKAAAPAFKRKITVTVANNEKGRRPRRR